MKANSNFKFPPVNPIGPVQSAKNAREAAKKLTSERRGRVADNKAQVDMRALQQLATANPQKPRGVARPATSAAPRASGNVRDTHARLEALNKERDALELAEQEYLADISSLEKAVQAMPNWADDVAVQIAGLNSKLAETRAQLGYVQAKINLAEST